MALELLTLKAAKKYTDESLAGGGAVKGKNCIISKIEEVEGGSKVTFSWTLDNGTVKTGDLNVKDGASIKEVAIDENNHIIVTLTDGSKIDGGELPQAEVEISKAEGNALTSKEDGLYVGATGVEISQADNNAIETKTDGLYVPKVAEVEISKKEKNILGQEDDGLYVPKTDLSGYVEAEDGKSLVADEDIAQIATNKTAIEVLNGDAETAGSVDKKLADAIAMLNKLEKKILDHVPTVEEAKDNVLYLVGTETSGTYNQYMLIDGVIANLGSTDIDLDGYAKTEDVVALQQAILDKGKVLVVGEDGKVTLETLTIPTTVAELEDADDYAKADDVVSKAQGVEFGGKVLMVNEEGNVEPSDIDIESAAWTGTTEEFELLDKSTLKDGQQINFTNDYNPSDYATKEYVDEKVLEVYSEEETICGTWIDGKPIYRTVLSYTTTGLKNISQLNADTVVNFSFKSIDKGAIFFNGSVPTSTNTIKSDAYINSAKTQLSLEFEHTGYTLVKFEVIIEYTKTTD